MFAPDERATSWLRERSPVTAEEVQKAAKKFEISETELQELLTVHFIEQSYPEIPPSDRRFLDLGTTLPFLSKLRALKMRNATVYTVLALVEENVDEAGVPLDAASLEAKSKRWSNGSKDELREGKRRARTRLMSWRDMGNARKKDLADSALLTLSAAEETGWLKDKARFDASQRFAPVAPTLKDIVEVGTRDGNIPSNYVAAWIKGAAAAGISESDAVTALQELGSYRSWKVARYQERESGAEAKQIDEPIKRKRSEKREATRVQWKLPDYAHTALILLVCFPVLALTLGYFQILSSGSSGEEVYADEHVDMAVGYFEELGWAGLSPLAYSNAIPTLIILSLVATLCLASKTPIGRAALKLAIAPSRALSLSLTGPLTTVIIGVLFLCASRWILEPTATYAIDYWLGGHNPARVGKLAGLLSQAVVFGGAGVVLGIPMGLYGIISSTLLVLLAIGVLGPLGLLPPLLVTLGIVLGASVPYAQRQQLSELLKH